MCVYVCVEKHVIFRKCTFLPKSVFKCACMHVCVWTSKHLCLFQWRAVRRWRHHNQIHKHKNPKVYLPQYLIGTSYWVMFGLISALFTQTNWDKKIVSLSMCVSVLCACLKTCVLGLICFHMQCTLPCILWTKNAIKLVWFELGSRGPVGGACGKGTSAVAMETLWTPHFSFSGRCVFVCVSVSLWVSMLFRGNVCLQVIKCQLCRAAAPVTWPAVRSLSSSFRMFLVSIIVSSEEKLVKSMLFFSKTWQRNTKL